MKPDTLRALRDLDRRFYLRHAEGFAGSRRLPWPGWDRALNGLAPRGEVLRVLDAGCAHGRLAPILAERLATTQIDYWGIDSCLPLLARGTQTNAQSVNARFIQGDLLASLPFAADPGDGFDLIALFGVLHHVPGYATRQDLLRRLGDLLTTGGRLVVTAWRVERQPRFTRKRVPWSHLTSDPLTRTDPENAGPEPTTFDPADLEDGDHLLSWGGDFETPRYCHATSDSEAESLVAATGLMVIDRFEADGPNEDRNLYLVLTNP